MREVMRSNDLVRLSWASATLAAAGIASRLLDGHVAAVEGSVGAFPRRLVVELADYPRARALLAEADAGLDGG
jgi:hypothetical protein